MTTTTSLASTATAAAATSSAATSRSTIAQNFDQFLLLLTTQLKNQSPLDPLDTNQFTQQLVQFASVEQQIKSNETLTALLASNKATTTANAASFVGLEVTADGTTTRLQNGKASWTINPARAGQITIQIKDKSGTVVAQKIGALSAGAQSFAWDGKTATGTAPDGDYTISVSGRDATGQGISVKTEVSGRVDGVDLAGDAPVLIIGSTRVPLANVRSIVRN